MLRLFICGFLITAVMAANVKAEDSVESVGYQIYTLGLQAAREPDPEIRGQLRRQIKLLQNKHDRLIEQGATVETTSSFSVAPLTASQYPQYTPVAPASAPATNWSQGSYRNFRPQQPMVNNGHYGSYRINPNPGAALGFGLGLQSPNPFTIGGYRYWKGPRFTWGSYPIRFKR